jgi:hypothetical protein
MKTSLRKIRVTRSPALPTSYPQPFKPSGSASPQAKKRVLVVEDQSAVCDLVSEMVQSHPRCVSVGTASDGLSAIELALRLKPDILVLDVIMPGVGGIEILRRLGGTRGGQRSGREQQAGDDPGCVSLCSGHDVIDFAHWGSPSGDLEFSVYGKNHHQLRLF